MRAFVVEHRDGAATAGVRELDEADLGPADVELDVAWSCLNFKDAMVVRPGSRVARRDVLVAGVDAAGTVTACRSGAVAVGASVLAVGHGFGTAEHGGLAERLHAAADALTPLPRGLSARQAMVFGTAGYTAMASILALERNGLSNDAGPVLVTGATGGVGSTAVALLAARGFEVSAMTGKASEHAWLRALGAAEVLGRDGLEDHPTRVLGTPRFAGAIDCVGGETLARLLRVLRWGAAVAVTGLVGGASLETTVYPFLTRNVAVLGIDSVDVPDEDRRHVWAQLACALSPEALEALVAREVGLDGVAQGLDELERGAVRGRILVEPRRRGAQPA